MIKLIIFDLDGTVAKIGKAADDDTVEKIKALERSGCMIAFCSGKPTFYLCGFARQFGLKEPILIGENGAAIQFGIDLPPKKTQIQYIPETAKKNLRFIRERLEESFGDAIWFQPNETELTPFFHNAEDKPLIEKLIKESIDPMAGIIYISHIDCFDIQYKEISKGKGLAQLSEMLGISPDEMVSVGDWTNDYPMFEYTSLALGINVPDSSKVDFNFKTISDALNHLLFLKEK